MPTLLKLSRFQNLGWVPVLTVEIAGITALITQSSPTINRLTVTTADGRTVKAIGMGDMHVKLPNGSKKTKVIFKNAIHTPDMQIC